MLSKETILEVIRHWSVYWMRQPGYERRPADANMAHHLADLLIKAQLPEVGEGHTGPCRPGCTCPASWSTQHDRNKDE